MKTYCGASDVGTGEIVRATYEQRPIGMILTMAETFQGELAGAPREAMPEFLGGKAHALALAGRVDEANAVLPESYVRGPAQIELQRAVCLAQMGDSVAAARHALLQLERLPAADHIRPIVDLAHRVDGFIPASDARLSEVVGYREYLSARRPIEVAGR
jgi:hypothetical protein